MNWTTLYITGKPGFHEEVLNRLSDSDVPFMPGSSERSDLALFWVAENGNLRELKLAIGSKMVFKYRLQFFNSLEEFEKESENQRPKDFTHEERALIKKMTAWEKTRNRLAVKRKVTSR